MRQSSISYILFLIGLLFCLSCKNKTKPLGENPTTTKTEKEVANQPTFDIKKVNKIIGRKSANDSYMEIAIEYPVLKGAPAPIADKINTTITEEVIASMEIEETETINTIEEAADYWMDTNKEYLNEEIDRTVTLTYDCTGKGDFYKHYATTELSVSIYMMGAHPNSFLMLSNYDLNNGALIELDDIILDSVAFNTLVEKAFYESIEGGELPAEKENYFWEKPFYLPANYAITKEGLYFFYNQYEIAPYAMGTFDFSIPYEDLKGLIKLP